MRERQGEGASEEGEQMLLAGKVILVTGGGRGIGAAISRVLAREGAAVAVNYSTSQERAEQTAHEIIQAGGKALAAQADVRDGAGVQRMMEQVVGAFGQLNGVVNNAIAGRQARTLDEASDADYANAFGFGCHPVL
ncbi:MAG: SDR family NAD(P)-dependent oxidoreductase, partial [Acidobacteria bacterium]|nr:SDR family NAD(P)-dependent oxidoreductase [Acidobacteriota bacterium]